MFCGVQVFWYNHPDAAAEADGVEQVGSRDGWDASLSGLEDDNSDWSTLRALTVNSFLDDFLMGIDDKLFYAANFRENP